MTSEKVTTKVPCPRCGGRGGIEAFRRVMSGVCFQCKGQSWITKQVSPATAKKHRQQYPHLNGDSAAE